MNDIIFEKYNGETVTVVIDGKEYPYEVVDNWSPEDFMKIRDEMLLKCQRESEARANSIYDAFGPCIVNATTKKLGLMPKEVLLKQSVKCRRKMLSPCSRSILMSFLI